MSVRTGREKRSSILCLRVIVFLRSFHYDLISWKTSPLFEERYASHFSILLPFEKFFLRKFDFPFVCPHTHTHTHMYAVFAYVGYIENYSWREKSVAFLARTISSCAMFS